MSCYRGVVYAAQMDIQISPSPILIKNDQGSFTLKLAIPPSKEFRKLDSLKFILSARNMDQHIPIGTQMLTIPKVWAHRNVLFHSMEFEIEDYQLNESPLDLQVFVFKKSKVIRTPYLEVSKIRKYER